MIKMSKPLRLAFKIVAFLVNAVLLGYVLQNTIENNSYFIIAFVISYALMFLVQAIAFTVIPMLEATEVDRERLRNIIGIYPEKNKTD